MAGLACVAPENSKFLWNNVVCYLEIKENILSLSCLKKLNVLNPRSLSSFNKSFSLLHVISVHYGISVWKVNGKGESLLKNDISSLFLSNSSPCFLLSLSVSLKGKNNLRKLRTFKLLTGDEKTCSDWCQWLKFNINETLKRYNYSRPKSLLIFVNPYGGKKKAESIYCNIISPLFKVAGIQETIVITRYRNHARDYVESNNLSAYDGVIAVGGDGMLNEIVNGILIKTQKHNGIDINTSNSFPCNKINFVKPEMKIGVIPAGSTNCLSYVSQGVDDPETSALHIICGECHPLDICSIHDDFGKFIRFSFSMTSYGYMGNVLRQSENLRTLGPSRYDFAGVHSFFNLQSYPSEVTYLPSSLETPVDIKNDKSKCRFPCAVCFGNSALNDPNNAQLYRQLSEGANAIECNDNIYTGKRSLTYPFFSSFSTSSKDFNIGLSRNNSIDSPVQDSIEFQTLEEINGLEKGISSISFTQSDISEASSSKEFIAEYKRNNSSASFISNKVGVTSVDSSNFSNEVKQSDGCSLVPDVSSFENNWKVSRGNFIMINSALMSCACPRCPEGLSPSAHLADGNIDLILLHDVSRTDFLKYLLSHTGKANRFNFPFVEVHRVRGFHYRTLQENFKDPVVSQQDKRKNSISRKCNVATVEESLTKSMSSCWNSDGEIIENPNISLWVHQGLINLFAKGIEQI